MTEPQLETAIANLRGIWQRRMAGKDADAEYARIIEARDGVLERYRPVFDPANLPRLSEETFRGFLQFKNNRHWLSLQRKGSLVCADMKRLREALAILLDESRPIEERLDQLVPARGPAFVPHLGKAILTPILLIHDPQRYGVWNQISENAMRTLSIWPDLERTAPFGRRYAEANAVMRKVAESVGIDLWILDALWWHVSGTASAEESTESMPREPVDGEGIVADAPVGEAVARFGLERHLHEFLRDNWDHTELARSWKLFESEGDSDAGYEFPTDVGRIDLLAQHRSEPRWLVIELKRSQSSDQTVGQVLRYMGWVKNKLARPNDRVEGLIVAHSDDLSVRYALAAVKDVSLRLYEVEFRLRTPPE